MAVRSLEAPERDAGAGSRTSRAIELTLSIQDPEVVQELAKHPEGEERTRFALAALRLGILALRQASGSLDATAVRREGERLLGAVRELLTTDMKDSLGRLTEVLRGYFDPKDGQLPQRLERLVRKDGELESLLQQHLGGDTSTLARTLAQRVGEGSPIFKVLSTDQTDGFLANLTQCLRDSLEEQRQHILLQFSLDDQRSALCRFLKELQDRNGLLGAQVSQDLEKLKREFSLDSEESALSRLVGHVERAQRTISSEFSLDNDQSALRRLSQMIENTGAKVDAQLTLDDEKSPLHRLRSEIMRLLEELQTSNRRFQEDVRATLEAVKSRKEEAARSTRHGEDFEETLGAVLGREVRRLNDVWEEVGTRPGRGGKVGDFVITLGPDSAAPGARIVVEAKANRSCTLPQALEEIRTARENRDAGVGLFVFSPSAAPGGFGEFQRVDQDVVAVWDPEDAGTDLFLRAALSVARALSLRQRAASDRSAEDLEELDLSLGRVEKAARTISEIATWARTVENNGRKIREGADRAQEHLQAHLDALREHLERLKGDNATA